MIIAILYNEWALNGGGVYDVIKLKMANLHITRVRREFKEVIGSEEVN